MATMRSLGFSVFTRYDGSGITRARRDIDDFSGSTNRSTSALNSWNGRIILATKALMVFGPALVPIGASMLAIAGAAATMGTAVGASMAVYGTAMKGAISNARGASKAVGEASTELATQKKILAQLEPGTAAYNNQLKRVSLAQKEYNDALKAFNPTQREYMKAQEGMNSSWQKFIKANEGKTLQTATAGVRGLTNGIALLQPLLDAAHPSILNVAKSFESWTKSASAKQYADLLANMTKVILPNLVTAGKNVLNVLGDGFSAFVPKAESLSKAIAEASAKLKAWSDGGGFQRFLQYVKDNGEEVRAFFKALGDAMGTIGKAMKDLGPLALGITTTMLQLVAALPPEWIANIVRGFIAFKLAVMALFVIQKLVTIFKAIQAAWFILSIAFTATPLGLLIAGIVALVAAIVLIATKTTWFQTAWTYTWNFIKHVADVVWQALQIGWDAFLNAMRTAWSNVSGWFITAWNTVWGGIKLAAETVWNFLKTAWEGFINGLKLIWDTVSGALSSAWSTVWNGIKAAAELVWNGLKAAWEGFINGLQTIWNAVSGALSAAWNTVWTFIKDTASTIWQGMQLAWDTFLQAITSAWNAFSGFFQNIWNTVWTWVKDTASTIWQGIQTNWQNFLTWISNAWNVFTTFFQTLWNTVWTWVKTTASTIWIAIQTNWQNFLTWITNAWNTFTAFFQNLWNTVWTWVKDKASEIWQGIQQHWDDFLNWIRNAWETFTGFFKTAWENVWNWAKDTAQDIWSKIGGVIEKAVNFVINLINGLIKGFNNITNFLDIGVHISPIPAVNFPGLADGGMVTFAYGGMTGGPGRATNLKSGGTIPGYAPGRDTIPAVLSRGEGVLTPEAVRGLGGPGFVHGANRRFAGHRGAGKAAGAGRGGRSWGAQDSHPNAFAGGGMAVQHFAVGGMTAAALSRAGVSLGLVSQGEYSNGSLSAGTHLGGGAVDLSTTSTSVLAALHAAGFAAWIRGNGDGMSPHIHAVLMNHPDLSAAAAAQVASFQAGGSGLGSGGGGGGGGIDIMGMLAPHIGKILHNVYRGLDPLSGIGGMIASLFGGGGGSTGGGDGPSGPSLSSSQQSRKNELMKKPKLSKAEAEELADLLPKADTGINRESIMIQPQPFTGRPAPAVNAAQGSAKNQSDAGSSNPLASMLAAFVLPAITRDHVATALGDAKSEFSGGIGFGGGFDKLATGFGHKLVDDVIPDFVMKKAAEATPPAMSFGGGGGDVQQWAGLATLALARAGLSISQLGAFLALMQAESGGNPLAVNNWDSNAAAGMASAGLMQVIPPTFATYRDPSLSNNILDPLANMTAAANYIKARYGGNVPGSPYADGTDNATPGLHLVGEEGPELVTQPGYAMFGGGEQVYTASQTSAMMSAPAPAPAASGGGGGGGSDDPSGMLAQLIAMSAAMSEAVSVAWSAAISSGNSGWSALKGVHAELIGQVGQDIPAAFRAMSTSSAAVWAAMNAQTMTSWALLRDGVYAEAQLVQGTNMPLAGQAMSAANALTWQAMNTDSTTQWGLMRDTTFTEAGDFIAVKMPAWGEEMNTAVSTSFQNMNLATAESWGGMQEATRGPVNWIISNAYNDGLARLWNEVASVIFEDGARTLPTVATLAKGGPVNGPGTGTSDSIPARLSKGEHVWTAREVSKAGGHGAVMAMRSAVMGGRVRGPVATDGEHAGFAAGGWNAGSDTVSGSLGLPALGELKRGFMMDEAEPFLDAFDSGVRSSLGGNNFRIAGAVADALSPSDWMRQYIEADDELNKIGSGGPPWIPGVSDAITSWGGVTVNQRTADMLNMAIGLGASFSASQGSFSSGVAASAGTHDGGGVVDLVPASNTNVGALRAVGFAAWNRGAAWGSPSFSDHIHAVALGDPTVSAGAAAQVMSYLAGGNGLADGGPDNFGGGIPAADGVTPIGGGREVDPADLEQRVAAFDRGGWIQPGQYAYNGTGRPELATPADDIENLTNAMNNGGRDGECVHVEFNFNGPVTSPADVRRAADEAIPKLRQALQSGTGRRTGGC